MKSDSSKSDKIFNIVLIVSLVLLLIETVIGFSVYYTLNLAHRLEYVECTEHKELECVYVGDKPNHLEIITKINMLTETNYSVMFDEEEYGGWTQPLLNNPIHMNIYSSLEHFTWSYTHEVLHKKWKSGNELFVNYQTFLLLYNSGDEFFEYCSIYCVNRLQYSRDKVNYDVRYYVYQYLGV